MNWRNGHPFFKHGIGADRVSFSGGRLAADLARHGGLTAIRYYGAQRFGDIGFFQADPISAWALLFRPMMRFDGMRRYALEFHDTSVYPTGYRSCCELEGVPLEHECFLANDALIFRLKLPAGTGGHTLEFELINTDRCTRTDKPTRHWERLHGPYWRITDRYSDETIRREKEAGYLTLAQRGDRYVPQVQSAVTEFGVAGGGPVRFRETPHLFRKHYYAQDVESGECFFLLGFGHKGPQELQQRLAEYCERRAELFAPPAENTARFHTGSRPLDSFLHEAGGIIDSLKVRDIPGGIRAADSGYWIWGWDGMVHADAHGWLNQSGFLAEMLRFYRDTADPVNGIFHEMTIDGRPFLSMAPPAQCLYAVMLYYYYVFTGDRALLREYIVFADKLVRRAGADAIGGLIRGVSLYPDHPEDLEQDGNDLSVFNNSIYFQALRTLERLHGELGDADECEEYRQLAERTRRDFAKFRAPEGGFYDSLSATDLSPRRHRPVYAILYETPFADELLTPADAALCGLFSTRQGCRILPLDDSRWMYDGNQLGMYMPCTELWFRELHSKLDPAQARRKLYADVIWNWSRLTLPEALTCEYENHGLTPDNPGRKQLFTVKAWVGALFRFAGGVELSERGLHFCDSADPHFAVSGLALRGSSVSIRQRGGSGPVLRLRLNGRLLPDTRLIPFVQLRARRSTVTVERA